MGGAFRPVALPGSSRVAATEGIAPSSRPPAPWPARRPPWSTRLGRDGRRLEGVEPYLGADGHLVALHEGDLTFLHAHPEQSDTPGTIRFGAAVPSPGRYRLFLQFKHDDRVRTVAHTLVVAR